MHSLDSESRDALLRTIYQDHLKLTNQRLRLQTAIVRGGDTRAIQRAIVDFLELSYAHIEIEEAAMRRTHYPRYALHKAEHGRIMGELKAAVCALADRRVWMLAATLRILEEVGTQHHQSEDLHFINHLTQPEPEPEERLFGPAVEDPSLATC